MDTFLQSARIVAGEGVLPGKRSDATHVSAWDDLARPGCCDRDRVMSYCIHSPAWLGLTPG
ncbi:hypothetical protein [Burkholderia anthina]|uniref:hypothetical protein n=1 Tax=Burkholderia anthina TaxID=179879 RepID=UPI0037BF9C36